MNCLFGCKRKVISPAEKQVIGSKHWKSDGWFFPCTMCNATTSSQMSFIIFNRNDYQQITKYLCKRCKYKMYTKTLKVISYVRISPHLDCCLSRWKMS